MAEMIVYRVQVHGEVTVEASSDSEAKELALAHFAESPMQYISIQQKNSVLLKPEE